MYFLHSFITFQLMVIRQMLNIQPHIHVVSFLKVFLKFLVRCGPKTNVRKKELWFMSASFMKKRGPREQCNSLEKWMYEL